MKGLEISQKFFTEYGLPMLEEQFPDEIHRIAAGLAGDGSECLGYDDEVSRDHDFDHGFCLWITREDYEKFGFRLSRAYAKLPTEYMGLKRQLTAPCGGDRRGVIITEDFYARFLGVERAPLSTAEWLSLPEHYLAAAVGGKVFFDPLGEFSATRNCLLKGYPDDVLLKKLAARLALAGQAGQYNYSRCIARGETGAAQVAIFEFVKNAVHAVYLLNNAYCPFYKWAYRGMRDLKKLSELETPLVYLTETGNSPAEAIGKQEIIEDAAAMLISELKTRNLSAATCNNLETHAYSVTDRIKNADIRNLHIMVGAE